MNQSLRELPSQTPRIETGPVLFDGDWIGIFIRGDIAMAYAMENEHAIETTKSEAMVEMHLRSLMNVLRSCDERTRRLG